MTILDLSPASHDPNAASTAGSAYADRFQAALAEGDMDVLDELQRVSRIDARSRFLTLLRIYGLHTAPVTELGDELWLQHHPAVAAIKHRCEQEWLAELEMIPMPQGVDPGDAVAAMRTIAARDRLPSAYRWLAKDADWDNLVTFLALEGGPDAGFDDLVAACQIGLTGAAKLELARNYWDEMGNGSLDDVHTTLHDRMVEAIDMPRLPASGQPTSALARTAMCGMFATNRWLQPEMLGALGLIELQAGPRCRKVLQAFDRLNAPRAAYPFYDVHADVDPRHGKDWLDNAITPTVAAHPEWSQRIVRGAVWRNAVTNDFLDDALSLLTGS